jgi:hypothetical protein
MLFRPDTLQAIADGTVTVAFRRWERPRVRPGASQRTPIGVISFDAVEAVERSEIDDVDARSAGFSDLPHLHAFLDRRSTGGVYRIRLRLSGPDPRVTLRGTVPDADQLREIERRLARLDRASRHGPWTRQVLQAIHDGPGVRAADLAHAFGRERLRFKLDVRKLKELGLTESLARGYRLSPRGESALERLAGQPGPR